MMLDERAGDSEELIGEKKRAAYECLAEAWADAEAEGIDADILAHAALFAAFTHFVDRYGERAAADYAAAISRKVLAGEYTLSPAVQ